MGSRAPSSSADQLLDACAEELAADTGEDDPEPWLADFPHEFSIRGRGSRLRRHHERFDGSGAAPWLLAHLAGHPDRQVRWALAQSSVSPRDVLQILAEDLSTWARMRVSGIGG